MDINKWFENNGSFEVGVQLYCLLPNASNNLIRSFKTENFSNFLTLKYELKKALNLGINVSIEKKKKVIEDIPLPEPEAMPFKYLIEESQKQTFTKETMAMYPVELHSTYRERISNFYMACELKFKLNRIPASEEKKALDLILKLEALWTKIDKAWEVLGYWKENNRLMPTEQSKDYSKLSISELYKEKALLEARVSKRKKTISGIESYLESNPDDKVKLNLYKKKLEELEQLNVDFETIKKLIQNE